MLNRRETTKLLLAGSAAAFFPVRGIAASREEWVEAVKGALDAATVPGSGTLLTLRAFGFEKKGRQAGMSAVIQMDWPPGYRSRKFEASEAGEQETFKQMVAQIVAEFREVNPEGVREVRFR
jgi:hypothetical protein